MGFADMFVCQKGFAFRLKRCPCPVEVPRQQPLDAGACVGAPSRAEDARRAVVGFGCDSALYPSSGWTCSQTYRYDINDTALVIATHVLCACHAWCVWSGVACVSESTNIFEVPRCQSQGLHTKIVTND